VHAQTQRLLWFEGCERKEEMRRAVAAAMMLARRKEEAAVQVYKTSL
jgi:hypothetical protein